MSGSVCARFMAVMAVAALFHAGPRSAHAADDVGRGEVLATVMLCGFCHSPIDEGGNSMMYDTAVRMTGGFQIVSPPYGTVYTRNITPDGETGIGRWSDKELKRAVTAGEGPGGGLTVMPWHFYSVLSDDDFGALAAYLRSLPPVHKAYPDSKPMGGLDKMAAGLRMVLPFLDGPSQDWYLSAQPDDAKSGQHGYLLDEPEEVAVPDPNTGTLTEKAERGKYLATIATCAYCHTPVTLAGQADVNAYSGGFKVEDPFCGTVYTANLTPDTETGIGSWSDEEIDRAVRTGVARDGRALCPSAMPWQAFAAFSDEEMEAIISWLRSLPPVRNRIPLPEPSRKPDGPVQRFVTGNAGR